MTYYVLDRAKELASSGGTGDFTLTGATASNFVAFISKLTVNGDKTPYCATYGDSEFETGILTRTGANTYSRAVVRSTNSDNAVNFTGAPTVFSTMPGKFMTPMDGPLFRANRITSHQSLSSGTPAEVVFNAEDFDTASCFSTSTGRFTPNIAGYYQVGWTVTCHAGSGSLSASSTALRKNGTSTGEGSYHTPNGAFNRSAGSDIVSLNGSTDYVSIFASATGTSPEVYLGADATFFWGRLVQAT